MIELINSRDPDVVNESLRKYTNLKFISRDRGKEYQAISGQFIHSADRFHLIMNLSDKITREVKKLLPHRILVASGTWPEPVPTEGITEAAKQKKQTVEQVRALNQQGVAPSDISRQMKMDRQTVAKYLETETLSNLITHSHSRKGCILDPHRNTIEELYQQKRRVVDVHRKLMAMGIQVKYRTLAQFIKTYFKASPGDLPESRYLKRSTVIKYIFSWASEEFCRKSLDKVLMQYPVLNTYRDFYSQFKSRLTALNTSAFQALIDQEYGIEAIDVFLAGLRKDYDAVMNAATYSFNNGITEGYINKLKMIKRSMYGRASLGLLARKTIYQTSVQY